MKDGSPSGWVTAEIGDVVAVSRPRSDPQEHPDLPFIGMENVEAHTMRLLGTIPARTMKSNATHFFPGDVLYGRLRPYLNKIVAPGFEGLASAEFIPLTPEAGIFHDFIRYRINAADFVSFTSHLDEGDRPRVDWDGIRRFKVLLPPSAEQSRIVEAVESYLTRLDDAVASLKRVQAKLKAHRASVLKAAVEGRLAPTEAALARTEKRDYEPAEVLLARTLKERRRRWEEDELAKLKVAGKKPNDNNWKAKYEEPLTPDTSTLPQLLEGWCWATIDQISECLDHLRVPVSKRERQNRNQTVPYYGANGQAGWIDRPLFDEALVLVVEDETFTGRTKPFSYLIEGPSWVNNHAHILRALGAISPRFLNASLAHYPFIPLTTGTTGRRKLTKKALMAAALPIPPHEEQERIMEIVDSLISLSDNGIITAGHQLVRSKRLRQAVLKWAFEGKLVDQDPNEEPADKLLARIRAKRPAVVPTTKKSRRRTAKEAA